MQELQPQKGFQHEGQEPREAFHHESEAATAKRARYPTQTNRGETSDHRTANVGELFRRIGAMLSRQEMERRGAAQGELTRVERFAVAAIRAFADHPLMKAIDDLLMAIAERLENSSLTPEQFATLQQAARAVRTIQTESLPAAYAYSDTMLNNRLEVLERYRQEVLSLPAEFRPMIPLRISGAEPWRYSPAIWETLNERRWIAADSPTKYISHVANRVVV